MAYESAHDHSLFLGRTSTGIVILVLYVDDIVGTGFDEVGIKIPKQHLCMRFHMKDLGTLKYFLGIEVARSENGINVSQRKYVLDFLAETGFLGARPIDTPWIPM